MIVVGDIEHVHQGSAVAEETSLHSAEVERSHTRRPTTIHSRGNESGVVAPSACVLLYVEAIVLEGDVY